MSALSVNADNDPMGLTPEMLRPQFSNLTPEAASLGRYGAFQVSEYSGAANISIPLYTVKSGDVSFPITLYYDATGIKVEQDATFVGLGWNLSYGGMISHVVCGEDDFRETGGYRVWNANWWKEKISSVNKSMPRDLPFYLENYAETKKGRLPAIQVPNYICIETAYTDEDEKGDELYERMSKGYDSPDVFQATFCGHNISFVIDKRRVANPNGPYPITILNNNPRKYKISYKTDGKAPSGSSGYPTSFEIIDDKGITYCFSGYSEVYDKKIDSYYLTKIYGPDGEKGKSRVEFENEKTRIFLINSRTLTKWHKPTAKRIFNQMDKLISDNILNSIYDNLINPPSYNVDVACGEGGRYYTVYPKKIITALDTIEFIKGKRLDIKDEHANCISGITIKSKIGKAQKKISFTYDNFSESTGSYKRLKLTSVKIDDQNYVFEYDDSIKLPSFASYSKDYWGYYNGANPDADKFVGCSPAYAISNGKVVPVEHYLEGSNRLASEKLCKVGMLKKITYPTGGYTLYEFEANRFNDKYYYPDANDKLAFPPKVNTYSDGSISVLGTMTKTMTLKATQEKYDIKINAVLKGTSDKLFLTIKDSRTNAVVNSFFEIGSKNIGKTVSFTLTKGSTYIIEAELTAVQANSSYTMASFDVTHDVENPQIASPTTKNENGGYSIGGGLRVKTIKNYDSDGTYLNGVKYEYTGGKLLSPTVQLEYHYVDFNYDRTPIYFSFYYANTEPSYSYICSLGIPATVGYDRVVKKEIDESEKVTYRKTVLDFNNYGYVYDDCNTNIMNLGMQNPFYINSLYDSQGHLNGMIKKDSVFVDSELASTTQYNYGSMPIDTIYYQKCLPLHLPVPMAGIDYNQLFFRKCNTWNYLTSKTETQYDSNGKQTTSNTTSFKYDPTNYQLSDLSVTDGTNTSRTLYSYPASNTLRFMQHNLSEVDGVKTYKNGKLTGGSKFTYKVHKNPQTGASFSVVETCRSLLPNGGSVTEMTVTSYDDYGNIREYTKKNGTPVTIIWSYNHQLPILEIVGKTYEDVTKTFTFIHDLEEAKTIDNTCPLGSMEAIHTSINSAYKGGFNKGAAEAYVTAYEYSPWGTVSRIIKPNGLRVEYVYDTYGRLKETKENGDIIQRYSYNYKNK